jgi:hypothetical protein
MQPSNGSACKTNGDESGRFPAPMLFGAHGNSASALGFDSMPASEVAQRGRRSPAGPISQSAGRGALSGDDRGECSGKFEDGGALTRMAANDNFNKKSPLRDCERQVRRERSSCARVGVATAGRAPKPPSPQPAPVKARASPRAFVFRRSQQLENRSMPAINLRFTAPRVCVTCPSTVEEGSVTSCQRRIPAGLWPTIA